MNRETVADLVAYVTQLVPAQQFDQYTALAWFDVLGDLDATFEQARAAAAAVARDQQWIFPSAIREKLLPILAVANPAPPAPAIEQKRAWEQVEDRSERISRGMAKVRAALAEAKPYRLGREDAAEVPENLRKAREVAKAHKAGQAYRDKNLKLGAAGGQLMNDINKKRALSRSRKE